MNLWFPLHNLSKQQTDYCRFSQNQNKNLSGRLPFSSSTLISFDFEADSWFSSQKLHEWGFNKARIHAIFGDSEHKNARNRLVVDENKLSSGCFGEAQPLCILISFHHYKCSIVRFPFIIKFNNLVPSCVSRMDFSSIFCLVKTCSVIQFKVFSFSRASAIVLCVRLFRWSTSGWCFSCFFSLGFFLLSIHQKLLWDRKI